jgi:hypothetical protein
MDIHREIDAPTNLIEVPAHVGLQMTLDALRVRLDAPADLRLTQWQLAPLHRISKRLAGCTWQVVGCLVPATDHAPDYPYLQYADPPIRLQAWLWRTSKPPRQLYGDLRWHPATGRRFEIVGPGVTSDWYVRGLSPRIWAVYCAKSSHLFPSNLTPP